MRRSIGFTGTQRGMTDRQRFALIATLTGLRPTELHHGDCIGADATAHEVALGIGIPVVIHPPINPDKRAFCSGDESTFVEILPQYEYQTRNGHILDESDLLIACPFEMEEIVRSGTWATVRQARSRRIPVAILYPDGSITTQIYYPGVNGTGPK